MIFRSSIFRPPTHNTTEKKKLHMKKTLCQRSVKRGSLTTSLCQRSVNGEKRGWKQKLHMKKSLCQRSVNEQNQKRVGLRLVLISEVTKKQVTTVQTGKLVTPTGSSFGSYYQVTSYRLQSYTSHVFLKNNKNSAPQPSCIITLVLIY
jgi:hypothetical protein